MRDLLRKKELLKRIKYILIDNFATWRFSEDEKRIEFYLIISLPFEWLFLRRKLITVFFLNGLEIVLYF